MRRINIYIHIVNEKHYPPKIIIPTYLRTICKEDLTQLCWWGWWGWVWVRGAHLLVAWVWNHFFLLAGIFWAFSSLLNCACMIVQMKTIKDNHWKTTHMAMLQNISKLCPLKNIKRITLNNKDWFWAAFFLQFLESKNCFRYTCCFGPFLLWLLKVSDKFCFGYLVFSTGRSEEQPTVTKCKSDSLGRCKINKNKKQLT